MILDIAVSIETVRVAGEDLFRFVYFVWQKGETKHKHRSVDDYAVCD